MEIQVVSDLHIEYRSDNCDPLDFIKPKAKILALLGDIGSIYKYDQLRNFMTKLCKHFETVLYVPGNHEFYVHKYYKPLQMKILYESLSRMVSEIDNLYMLDRNSVVINNICIIGCTLWSEPKRNVPRFIVNIKGMTTDKYMYKHKKDLLYIEKMIEYTKYKNLKLVVLTHYSPTYDVLLPRKLSDKYVSLYATDLNYLLKKENIDTWVFGHIHQNIDTTLTPDGTRLVANQLGKPNDNITTFIKDFIIKIN